MRISPGRITVPGVLKTFETHIWEVLLSSYLTEAVLPLLSLFLARVLSAQDVIKLELQAQSTTNAYMANRLDSWENDKFVILLKILHI